MVNIISWVSRIRYQRDAGWTNNVMIVIRPLHFEDYLHFYSDCFNLF